MCQEEKKNSTRTNSLNRKPRCLFADVQRIYVVPKSALFDFWLEKAPKMTAHGFGREGKLEHQPSHGYFPAFRKPRCLFADVQRIYVVPKSALFDFWLEKAPFFPCFPVFFSGSLAVIFSRACQALEGIPLSRKPIAFSRVGEKAPEQTSIRVRALWSSVPRKVATKDSWR